MAVKLTPKEVDVLFAIMRDENGFDEEAADSLFMKMAESGEFEFDANLVIENPRAIQRICNISVPQGI